MTEASRTILVIDDEERVRELLLDFLSEYDEFELQGAGSGEEALEQLRMRPMDLCVVDLRLPGMNGARFIEEAAATGLCRRFIVHTGSVDFLLPPTLQKLGMVDEDIFYKPVNALAVVDRIRQRLNGG
ncbi:MAG TPA: response regulator [Humidesulfovibrio sp.]|uniref:response regulator n=1 Tax=Humidesulfovibrio sp. TaxID=2910988 RepID=UPI002C2B8D84|nr:response regulator [Humidesulfovibrio sp.]HWR03445.1 response regulator [Humidesulfovibrio sp.]